MLEAGGRGHHGIRNRGNGCLLLHAPGDLRDRAEPLVDADAGVGDGAGLEVFEVRAQCDGDGPDLLAGKLVCPTGGAGTEVGQPYTRQRWGPPAWVCSFSGLA